jgi:hypothetical protein
LSLRYKIGARWTLVVIRQNFKGNPSARGLLALLMKAWRARCIELQMLECAQLGDRSEIAVIMKKCYAVP